MATNSSDQSEESDTEETPSPLSATTLPLAAGEANGEEAESTLPTEASLPLDTSDSQPTRDEAEAPPPPARQIASAPKTGRRGLKLVLIGVAILLVLSATGAGITYYALTRPKPSITVTSDYQVGKVPAGSPSTALHIEGKGFSAYSAITFLLDGRPAPGSQIVPSDENGALEADLMITAKWKIGAHQLTARDASGYITHAGVKVMVVHPGEAHTPGPDGSPADDTPLFTLYVTIIVQSISVPDLNGAFQGFNSNTEILTIQGKSDPAGGAVCDLQNDDGQTHTQQLVVSTTPISLKDLENGNFTTLPTEKITTAYTCSGTYQGGKISYTEMNTVYKDVQPNGVTCAPPTPRVSYQLEGTFNSAATISGTYSAPAYTVTCSNGSSRTVPAVSGTWTGILSS